MNYITLDQLENYIDSLIRLETRGQVYRIDWGNNTVETDDKTYTIVIPESILKNIKVEEN